MKEIKRVPYNETHSCLKTQYKWQTRGRHALFLLWGPMTKLGAYATDVITVEHAKHA